jgi:hypothetical protein
LYLVDQFGQFRGPSVQHNSEIYRDHLAPHEDLAAPETIASFSSEPIKPLVTQLSAVLATQDTYEP